MMCIEQGIFQPCFLIVDSKWDSKFCIKDGKGKQVDQKLFDRKKGGKKEE